jgi:2-polyprenyl-3-methyl-5-hydroxy-6-metoxy-1,4-benzoquinol methylase
MPPRDSNIQTLACPTCHVCGSEGVVAYQGLTDRLFGVPGAWNLKKCEAAGCGTYWLDPMPVEEDLAKLYANYYTHGDRAESEVVSPLRGLWEEAGSSYLHAKYGYKAVRPSALKRLADTMVRLNPAWSSNLDFSVFYLPAKPGGRLLEVGCGAGAMLDTMASKGWQVVGVDFDARAVEAVRSKGRTVYHGGVEEQNFRTESFDAVVMNHVIEHVHDPRGLIDECRRILRKDGSLVVITPNPTGNLHRIYGKDWRGLEPPRHLYLFSLTSLSRLASNVGFSAVEGRTTVHGAPYVWLASHELRKHGVHVMGAPPQTRHRLFAQFVAFGLGLLNVAFPNHGEEVVLLCKK